jgi:UMF1 family MFS transporter
MGTGARAPLRARISWMLFDWAVQPFYTLVLTFLFAPYFANTVVGDGPRGQTLWGYGAAAAGIIVAAVSPFLGAMADGRGRRKPWIALLAVILSAAMASLWFAVPGAPFSVILLTLVAFVCATACAEFSAVFSNAIMPGLVPQSELGRLSGAGWACGYFGGLVSLAVGANLHVAFDAVVAGNGGAKCRGCVFDYAPGRIVQSAMRDRSCGQPAGHGTRSGNLEQTFDLDGGV